MHLSRYTDYAYRVLVYTAANEKRCTLQEIGNHYGISVEHLRKVVHNLSQLNYLRTYKGKSGGMELNIAPENINLGDIYREFELARESVIDCKKLKCILNPSCRLKRILHQSEKVFISELDKYTLADIIDTPTLKIISATNL